MRNQFDIFYLTLAGLIPISSKLFVNGTSLLKANANIASLSLISHSKRFLPLVSLYRPPFPGVLLGGSSTKGFYYQFSG